MSRTGLSLTRMSSWRPSRRERVCLGTCPLEHRLGDFISLQLDELADVLCSSKF
jgi:hypothetical protein